MVYAPETIESDAFRLLDQLLPMLNKEPFSMSLTSWVLLLRGVENPSEKRLRQFTELFHVVEEE